MGLDGGERVCETGWGEERIIIKYDKVSRVGSRWRVGSGSGSPMEKDVAFNLAFSIQRNKFFPRGKTAQK